MFKLIDKEIFSILYPKISRTYGVVINVGVCHRHQCRNKSFCFLCPHPNKGVSHVDFLVVIPMKTQIMLAGFHTKDGFSFRPEANWTSPAAVPF